MDEQERQIRKNRNAPRRSTIAAIGLITLAAAIFPVLAQAFVHPVALGLERQPETQPVDGTAELHCLALNIYHEARGESAAGKHAVGRVTINRVHSARYPGSICKVVWQRGQFSWTRDGRPDRPYNLKAWDEALRIAGEIFALEADSPVGRATHYHAVYVRPFWARVFRRVGQIGKHIFYEQPERS